MDWLRKIRKSAYFVDCLLILAAILAILGLASFVHLRSSKPPVASAQTKKIASAGYSKNDSVESIKENSDSDASSSAPNEQQQNSSSNNTSINRKVEQTCTTTCTLSETTNISVVTDTCDEVKKSQLLRNYNQQVQKEDDNYRQKKSQQNLLQSVNRALEDLTHQETLNNLLSNLNTQLSAIGC